MMKKIIIAICILINPFIYGYGQNKVLVLKNRTSGKEEVVQEGNILKVVCKNGLIFKGKFLSDNYLLLSDSVMLIDTNKINIDQIESIKRKFSGQNALGVIFTGVGGCLGIGSISSIDVAAESGVDEKGGCINGGANALAAAGIVLGVAVIITGVTILAGGKKYESAIWDISVRTK